MGTLKCDARATVRWFALKCDGKTRRRAMVPSKRTFKDKWFRSRTRGETRHPGGISVSCLASYIRQECPFIFFLPCYICHYIGILCKHIRVDSKFKAIAPWLLEKIILNCVLSRTARLYTIITHNVPGKAICVPILWFDSLYLNNLLISKHVCKVVLDLFCIFSGKYLWTTSHSS